MCGFLELPGASTVLERISKTPPSSPRRTAVAAWCSTPWGGISRLLIYKEPGEYLSREPDPWSVAASRAERTREARRPVSPALFRAAEVVITALNPETIVVGAVAGIT